MLFFSPGKVAMKNYEESFSSLPIPCGSFSLFIHLCRNNQRKKINNNNNRERGHTAAAAFTLF
jgi:hypothetical protein